MQLKINVTDKCFNFIGIYWDFIGILMYSIVSVCLSTNISQTLRVNISKTVGIKNTKFSGYYFYMNSNIYEDFQICISVSLK